MEGDRHEKQEIRSGQWGTYHLTNGNITERQKFISMESLISMETFAKVTIPLPLKRRTATAMTTTASSRITPR